MLLNNIRETNDKMTVTTNGGKLCTQTKGNLKNYGDVWYSPKAITNILCLKNVSKKHRVTYDSKKDDVFVVHKETEKLIFKPLKNGLYVHDTKHREISLLNSVEENKTK